jgi:arylsulfatase A-like enzyme
VLDDPVITLDLFPTILAACGVDPPAGVKLDGVNLLPWLAGKSDHPPHDTLYWRFKPQFAIRDGSMKLVRSIDGKVALYDLSRDLGETKDLASEQPEVVKALQEKFDAWNAGNKEPLWPGKQEGMARRPGRGAGPATKPAG